MSNFKTLQLSFQSIELNDPSYYTQDLGCYIQLTSPDGNQRFVDVVILSDQTNKANIPISNLNEKIQFIIKRMSLNQVIGSVSIQVQEFHQVPQATWEQWLTLFENLNDDDYDGQLYDENDDELPRVQLIFNLLEYEVKSASPSPIKDKKLITMAIDPLQVQSPQFDNNSFNFGISESASPQIKKFITSNDVYMLFALILIQVSVQANIQGQEQKQFYKVKLELEKMNEFKRKYDHSKQALQKMQKEYMELLNLYNQSQEELKRNLSQQNKEIKGYKIQLSDLSKQNQLLKSEIEVYKKLSQENNYLSSATFQQDQSKRPQSNNDMASRLVIEDMNKQIRALQSQLDVRENYQSCTELKERNEERLQQLTKSMGEQILLQKDEKFVFLQELQKIESSYCQQQDIIRQLNEKCSRVTLQFKQKNDEKMFLEKEVQRLNKECQQNQKKILDLTSIIQSLKEQNIEGQEKFQEQWNLQNQNYNALESEKTDLEQQLEFKIRQLNQYSSIVGPIDDYFALQDRCQHLQQKKNEIQDQLNEYIREMRQKDDKYIQDNVMMNVYQIGIGNLKIERERTLWGKDRILAREKQRIRKQSRRGEKPDKATLNRDNKIDRNILINCIFQSLLITSQRGENVKLSNIASELEKSEFDKENLSSQLYQTTEELIVHQCASNKSVLNVENQLEELMERLFPPIKFIKQKDNKYKFGSQCIELFMLRNKLMVRHEQREFSVLQFLKTYLVQEIFLKNNGKIDPLYIQEWQNRINELCNEEEQEERPLQRHPNWPQVK